MPPSIRRGRRRLLCLLLLLPALLLALNTLIARRLLSASTVANQIISGRIVGQPVAFAHSVLRRRQLPTSQNIARNESVAVAIVGGGVAGLVAAWTLKLKGIDAIVLEHEEQPGGNARWGEDGPGGLKYPWGAHYIPIPSRRMRALRAFFEALGLLLPRPTEWASVGSKGEWMVEDAANAQELHGDVAPGVPTCKEPTERLYYPPESPMQSSSFVGWRDGTDGVVPYERMSADDVSQLKRFRAIVKSEATRQTADGKAPFTLPLADCSRDPHAVHLDATPLNVWLDERGLASSPLRWFIEYGTRDDYGASINATSAWAGLHYFAARASEERFEWREGNGHIIRKLLALLEDGSSGKRRGSLPVVRTNSLVYSIEQAEGASEFVRVRYAERPTTATANGESDSRSESGGDATLHELYARRVIYAAPLFTAKHIIRGGNGWAEGATSWLSAFTYAPWLVANLHLTDAPETGGTARCDNVLYQSSGLGYTLSTHDSSSYFGRRSGAVLTYYRALTEQPVEESRKMMQATPWQRWKESILNELSRAHPEIRTATTRLDVRLIGHAMTRPTPGLVWGAARAQAAASRPFGKVHFAHSDLSALPLFEEAVYWGQRVASEVGLAVPA